MLRFETEIDQNLTSIYTLSITSKFEDIELL